MDLSAKSGAVIMLALLCACSTIEESQPRNVNISFDLQANGQSSRCGVPLGLLGHDHKQAYLHDARFYIQDVALIRRDSVRVPVALQRSDWQNEQVALLDFEDATGGCSGGTPETNQQIVGSVPGGDYVGLSFTMGVPQSLNHTSTELEGAPLDVTAMGWSWQVGRKFAKIEVDPQEGVERVDGSRAATWYIHLGSTGCSGNPVTGETVSCLRSNRIPLHFEVFNPSHDIVVLDLSSLLAGSEIGQDQGMAVGCMSGPDDPECGAVFQNLGLDLHSGKPSQSGSSAFVVRSRIP
ncbi:MbnP family copper-binding protein [Pseudomonas sp. LRF_L74]|uniref:MbnP family copper-binding protein n=1 Tax=Pseudomonas sp. LRF_L74 TaxID=3369422 RepID=UPI003F61C381